MRMVYIVSRRSFLKRAKEGRTPLVDIWIESSTVNFYRSRVLDFGPVLHRAKQYPENPGRCSASAYWTYGVRSRLRTKFSPTVKEVFQSLIVRQPLRRSWHAVFMAYLCSQPAPGKGRDSSQLCRWALDAIEKLSGRVDTFRRVECLQANPLHVASEWRESQ